MILERWAENLLSAKAPPDIVDLHMRDTMTAFFKGITTHEGQLLAASFGQDAPGLDFVVGGIAGVARLSECDDIHLASCVTPGAAVVPVALMLARDEPTLLSRAITAGYAAGVTLGRAIGANKALSAGVWPSLLAASVMATVAASVARGITPNEMAQAMAWALEISDGHPTGRPQPYRRWDLFADAVAAGISRPDIVLKGHARGRQADLGLLTQSWLVEHAGHDDVDIGVLEGPLPSLAEVGFKPFPIARQGLNAVIAFQNLLKKGISPEQMNSIEVFVPPQNLALLSRPVDGNRLTRLCNIGFQLACAALAPEALDDPERETSPRLMHFAAKVSAVADSKLNLHLPDLWPARVVVKSSEHSFEETVARTDFDAGSPRLHALLREKSSRLAPGNGIESSSLAELWQAALRHVKMAAARQE